MEPGSPSSSLSAAGQIFPATQPGRKIGRRLLVISPHLDDAVFGCGDALAAHPGSTVVTVFACGPAIWLHLTAWDRAAGFRPGHDAMARRRQEDREALRHLEAHPIWLPFCDSQYAPSPEVEDIAALLAQSLVDTAPHAVYLPLGLGPSDHRLAHEAAVSLIPRFPLLEWFAYEEAIHRRLPTSGKAERQDRLRERGLELTWLPPGLAASATKRRSLACYGSQLRALSYPGHPGWNDALEPETHWALRSPVLR
jgi:LmbE family N-acetylglucosaminyl deacetylase